MDFTLLETRSLLTTFVVDTLLDGAGAESDGLLSLREAIVAANTNAAFADAPAGEAEGDIIRFAPELAQGQIDLIAGELEITDDLRIQGGANNLTIDAAASNSRIFSVNSSELVTFGGLNLTNGVADRGGAILTVGSGVTVVSQTIFTQNTATSGGGGAVYVAGGGEFYASDSRFLENSALGDSGSGGAIYLESGDIGIFGGSVLLNRATLSGGGIEIVEGNFYSNGLELGSVGNGNIAGLLSAAGSTTGASFGGGLHVSGEARTIIIGGNITGNQAVGQGGGLWNQEGSRMFIRDTVIEQNSTAFTAAFGDVGGGGIFNNGGNVSLRNVDIFDNRASDGGRGGGILSISGIIDAEGVDISSNVAFAAGAGISSRDGVLNFRDSNFSLNRVGPEPNVDEPTFSFTNGGAVVATGFEAVSLFSNTVFSNNSARATGGAIVNGEGAYMRLTGVTIEGNVASDLAGGAGGGVLNAGRMGIFNSSFRANRAQGSSTASGGGLFTSEGQVFITGTTFTDNFANGSGGGITVSGGRLILNDSNVDGNIARDLEFGTFGNGGGIVARDGATVIVSDSSVSANVASRSGGGLWNDETSLLRIDNTNIVGNVAEGDNLIDGGGGIYNRGGRLTVVDSTINSNSAIGVTGSGGGVLSTDGEVLIFDTDINSNNSVRSGGGLEIVDGFMRLEGVGLGNNGTGIEFSAAPGNGGGLHVTGNNSTVVLVDTVFNNNVAANQGGAIWNQAGSFVILQGTENSLDNNESLLGHGGAIYNKGFLRALDSVFNTNVASTLDGGALFNTRTGVATITGSTFIGNEAQRSGGAIANFGTLNLAGGQVRNNDAGAANGGVFTDPDAFTTIDDTEILFNNPE